MTRTSYILFALTIVCLTVSLILYKRSWEGSRNFNERVNTVNSVLLLLERTEKLEHLLRKTVFEKKQLTDSTLEFDVSEKSEADLILNRLHDIVLYEEQRSRIDTIRLFFDLNFNSALKESETASYYWETPQIIARAKTFAERRLKEQQEIFQQHEERVIFWINLVLILSFTLFGIGIWSTVYENKARKKLKNFHELILSNASIGICVYEISNGGNRTGIKLTFSNFGALIRGKDDQETLINLADYPLTSEDIKESIKVVHSLGKSVTKEIRHNTNGKIYWFIINLSKVASNHVAFYYQDITKIKSYENELNIKLHELVKVNKDLEQFAHATSHDLREPFRKIQVMADMMLNNYNAANNTRYLEGIIKASTKGSLLVEQILNYSKIQFDKSGLILVDLSQVLTHVIEDLELIIVEKHASIHLAPLPVIKGNEVQMVQLFSNLISNSLKFSDPNRKPEITITCKFFDRVEGIAELNPAESYYLITVEDNGIGFDESHAERIFNAFERLNAYSDFPGFGLGLSLCKKIVMNHQGSIKAQSIPGKGSKFLIYLPKPA